MTLPTEAAKTPIGAAAVICGAILLQVFVPAIFDIVVSIAIAAGGFMLGRATAKRQ